MKKCCSNCKHWQGTKYSKIADCYFVVGTFWKYRNIFPLGLPFDPLTSEIFLKNIKSLIEDEGINRDSYVFGLILYLDDEIKKYKKILSDIPKPLRVSGLFIQTPKDYKCEHFKERPCYKNFEEYWDAQNKKIDAFGSEINRNPKNIEEEIHKAYLEEISNKGSMIYPYIKDKDYPNGNYDYSTDNLDDFEYQQNQYL